jgi:hypothetical protein
MRNYGQKFYKKIIFRIGDWGLGIGDWGLGIGPINELMSAFLN